MFFILILSVFLKPGTNKVLCMIVVSSVISACVSRIIPLLAFKKFGQVDKSAKYYQTNVAVDRGIYALSRHLQYLAYIFLVMDFSLLSRAG